MGCDGGTIPTRDELVRLKKKPEQKDKNADREAKWKRCAITQEPLQLPILACELGRLYNKESVLEFLLDRSKFESSANFNHLRGLKDVHELQLTENPAQNKQDNVKGDHYIDTATADYICPVTGLEMSGQYRFCYLQGCHCVFSERAIKEVKTDVCNKCGRPYKKEDIITINGTEEDVETLRCRMEERRALAKAEKKAKRKQKAVETVMSSSIEDGPSTSKQRKTEGGAVGGASGTALDVPSTSKPRKLAETRGAASGSSKLTNGDVAHSSKTSSGASKHSSSKLAIGSGQGKKGNSIQEDKAASDTYKSLFTTSHKAKNQMKGNWVTFNPFYN